MHDDINQLILKKNKETYVFHYSDSDVDINGTLRHIGKCASDPELSFSWYDAAVLVKRIRESRKLKPSRFNTLNQWRY